MTEDELFSELLKRIDHSRVNEPLINELEVHQLELEIQNRELRNSHRELTEINRKYVDLFDFAPVGFLSLNDKGAILEANLTAARMLNTERQAMIGKNLSHWVNSSEKKSFRGHLESCIERPLKKVVKEFEFSVGDDNETCVEVHSIASFENSAARPVIRAALVDVTERRKAREAVAESKFLREEKELREKFISTLSHDLRSPLTSSQHCARMLNGAINDIKDRKEVYQLLIEELNRADKMVRELLDVNKIRGGEILPMVMKKCDLAVIVTKCIARFQSVHKHRPINFRKVGNVTGTWSPDGLYRVMENLLSNAYKYGETGQSITVSVEDKKQSVLIVVHNYGDPIPQREQKKIFEAFHRTHEAREGEAIGWGLGLSLVHMIVRRHEGTISVRSNFEEGTSFIISIPRTKNQLSPAK